MSLVKSFIKPTTIKIKCLNSFFLNSFHLLEPCPSISFVVEKSDWSIRWDGLSITKNINTTHPGISGLISDPSLPFNRVVHFGSQYMWVDWANALPKSNKYIVTFFHGKPSDDLSTKIHIDRFLDLIPKTEKIITASRVVENRLLNFGIPRNKLIRIPIGVDINTFSFANKENKIVAKKKLGIEDNIFCIGSFQKDGIGWNEGLKPKLIKGPDIFLDTIKLIAKEKNVCVLLTGPARGYIKKGLEVIGVPYKHIFLQNYQDIVTFYHAIDLYIMTSREEGGPKSILESMATGTPIIASKCGMAEDLLIDGVNGFLTEIGDSKQAAEASLKVIFAKESELSKILKNARKDIIKYDWKLISEIYLNEVYLPLLNQML
jgi:glycosyltransferase involved in cell wall biosynthesis